MANKVEICGVDTAKLPLYKEAEMTEMLERIKGGDTSVREKFINGNLRLVRQRDTEVRKQGRKSR